MTDTIINDRNRWIDKKVKLPDEGVLVQVKCSMDSVNNPNHPGFKFGEWTEYSMINPLLNNCFECDFVSGGNVTHWKYISQEYAHAELVKLSKIVKMQSSTIFSLNYHMKNLIDELSKVDPDNHVAEFVASRLDKKLETP